MLEKTVLYFEQIYSPDSLADLVQHQVLADKSYRQDCIPTEAKTDVIQYPMQ